MSGNRESNGGQNCPQPQRSSTSTPSKRAVTIVSPNNEELVSITPNERNWRGICIALLVIVAVLSLILFFIVLLSPPYEGPLNPGTKFSVEQVTGSEFKSTPFNGTWISDVEFVFRDHYGGVSIFNAKTNSIRSLINNSTFRMSNGVDFLISADRKYILIAMNLKKVFTNTKVAKYRIQDVASITFLYLTTTAVKGYDHEIPFVQDVLWSPRGNALAFVSHNDLYYKPEAISNTIILRITYSGSSHITNGSPDWLYQEQITRTRKCFWFSLDGNHIAFATFNDTAVGEFKYPIFKSTLQYPEISSIYYPKVGTSNPEVSISIADLVEMKDGTYITLKKPMIFANENPYFINAAWNQKSQLAVIWLNRKQTFFVITVCSKPNWNCDDVHVEKAPDGAWVEPSADIIFSNNGTSLVTILSITDGMAGRYPQICYIDLVTKIMTPITHGKFAVTNIKAWDQINKVIYFEAAPEGKPSQRHIYNVSVHLNFTNSWRCLTCFEAPLNITSNIIYNTQIKENISYSSNSSKLNSEFNSSWIMKTSLCSYVQTYFHSFQAPISYFVVDCLGPAVPKTYIMSSKTGEPTYLLNNQTALAEKYASMAKPQLKMIQIELEGGYQAQVKLLYPPVLRERLEMVFPFILYIDTSPGSQSVTDKWSVDWNTYLVSSMHFIVGTIDARGSCCQSDEMKYEISRKFGIVDVEDQFEVLLYLRDTVKFIDRTRIGVWGSGYGGYVSGKLLEQDNGTFRCGIAVAPITSWAHYLSYWTERFMGTQNVTDNYRGYDESDLSKKASKFGDKKFLLIHGTADKLVHYQHSMLLVHAFSKHGVLFRHLTYPDEGHDFSESSHHVIRAMETFWNDCFGPIEYEYFEEGISFLNFAQ